MLLRPPGDEAKHPHRINEEDRRSPNEERELAPDSTAARVALWRALHTEADAAPHVFDDSIGLELLAPGDGWVSAATWTRNSRVRFARRSWNRARFIEDLVAEQAAHEIDQYVILGAGLDSFAQRRPELAHA